MEGVHNPTLQLCSHEFGNSQEGHTVYLHDCATVQTTRSSFSCWKDLNLVWDSNVNQRELRPTENDTHFYRGDWPTIGDMQSKAEW